MRVSISAISLLLSFVLNWTVYAILAGIYYGWELFRKCKAFISFFGSVLEIAKSKGHYFRYFIFWIVKPTKLYKLINKKKCSIVHHLIQIYMSLRRKMIAT